MNKMVGIGVILSSTLVIALSFNACTKGGFATNTVGGSSQSNLGSSAPPTSPPLAGLDGKMLYATNCSACHGNFDATTKRDRTFENINAALGNIPQMGFLKASLTADQVQAIATALKTDVAADGTACTPSSVGNTLIRRLNRNELQYSLVDLVGVNQNFVAAVDVDPPGKSGFSNDASALTIGSSQLDKIMTAIETAVNAGLNMTNSPFLVCTNNVQDVNCAKTKLTAFARNAYRHTLSAAEINALVAVYNTNASAGFKTALGLAMQRALLSPSFMYVTAFSGGTTNKGKALTPQEFAGRLALFLWNSVPDATLLDLADGGTLKTDAVLKAQISRMLKDARGQRFSSNMFREWLGYDKVGDATVVIRNGITAQLRTDMINETATFVSAMVSEDKSLASLINADYTYVNANLASHYGIAGISGTNFQKVSLANTGRRGVVSQASILTAQSNADDSRPVVRGFFLLDKILCQTPPPPPPNVDTGALNNIDRSLYTIREVMALHRANPTCASCHNQMDPLGLSLENFDQLGRYRTVYTGGKSVDASGDVFQKTFNSYADLSVILAQQASVRSCLASKVLSYAVNRAAGTDEKCMGNKMAALAVQDSSKLSDLIYQVVINDMFNYNVTDSK